MQSTPTPVQFNDLRQITTPRFGLVFSYPADWDQQYLPQNSDGLKFVDPDDSDVSITGYGAFVPTPNIPTIFDAEKEWKSYILSLKDARIIEATASGATAHNANNANEEYAVDGWRVVYQYVNDKGASTTDMAKVAVANGREVDLVMEAPTREFPRYREAFLQLGDKMLLLTQCTECSGQ